MTGWMKCRHNSRSGMTLVEIMIVTAIIAILAAIATVSIQVYAEKARIKDACADIASMQVKIAAYQTLNGVLPNSLTEIDSGTVPDPWGNPYRYTNFETAPPSDWRKDRNLHPLNTDYDLWSVGRDGRTNRTLTAEMSHDDVIRASDGAYIGIAENY